mmetsp:Transcript_31610/g.98344  ORF Transcript_31610/g.98344 Transcript_31610/m.98344 type:complete len:204 (+) Transcript_31610:689-1300(+)
MPGGSTVRRFLSAGGPMGKTLRPSAPCLSAASASEGVPTPGKLARPRTLACWMTRTLALGLSTKCPPTSATARTSPTERTPAAPTSAPRGGAAASSRRLCSAPCAARGTASSRTPASARAWPAAITSSGPTPSSTATTGQACSAASQALPSLQARGAASPGAAGSASSGLGPPAKRSSKHSAAQPSTSTTSEKFRAWSTASRT